MSAPQQIRKSRVSDLQQQLLLEASAIAVFVGTVRGDQLRISWSPALRGLFGIDANQSGWRGGPLFNAHVLPDDVARLRMAVTQLLEHGVPLQLRYTLRYGEQLRWMQVSARLLSEPGKTRVVGVLKDCSPEVSGERHMQASQERLQSVGRLTLLGEVASGLAHELNQPLAAITTFAQAGERLLGLPEPRVEKAQQVFREVSQQSLRAGEIIRHMRSLIKRRAAQVELVSSDVLMSDFLALANPMARASQVQLLTRIEGAQRPVRVDVTQIHQAMMILFQNALEATREAAGSAPQVRVALLNTAAGLEWSISDQGPGVSEAIARQMFQPFFSTKEQGTGLGLISCRNILEAHGCRLSFENLPAGGCRFWFVLP